MNTLKKDHDGVLNISKREVILSSKEKKRWTIRRHVMKKTYCRRRTALLYKQKETSLWYIIIMINTTLHLNREAMHYYM